MFEIKEYKTPNTLEEAYNLLTDKKNNVILGGTTFLRMGNKKIYTAIDLKNMNLNYIKKTSDNILIGADVTYRQLETSPIIKDYFNGIISNSVVNVVGIQYRNMARVGSTVFSKFGFSDLLPPLLSVNAKVRLFKGGIISLESFLEADTTKDILIEVILPLKEGYGEFSEFKNSSSDYPILNLSTVYSEGQWSISVGARPSRGKLAKNTMEFMNSLQLEKINAKEIGEKVSNELSFGSNMRGSKEYRQEICSVLVKKTIESILNKISI